jgi:hypothetical protein
MSGMHNSVHLHFPPSQHARVCLLLAIALFGLSASAYFWNEAVHYRLYIGLGLVFSVFGLAPFVAQLLHRKPK